MKVYPIKFCTPLCRFAPLLWIAGAFMAALSMRTNAQQPPSAKPGKTVRIALVSDTHTTRGAAEDQPLYKGRLDLVIADVNRAKVDVVLIAGDLTQSGKAQERDDFAAQIKGFTAPILLVPGNHDIGNKLHSGKPGGVTASRVEAYEKAFGPSFWVDTRHGVRIIGVNSPLLGSGLPREIEQWTFLEKELAQTSSLPTLLLSHYPLFIKSPDEPGGVYWNVEPEPRKHLLALLKQAKASAVLSGHLHYPLTLQDSGITFITTHPVSFGLPRDKQPEGWTLITITSGKAIAAEAHDVETPKPETRNNKDNPK